METTSANNKSIVIIDDSEIDIFILKSNIHHTGCTADIISFTHPARAYEYFRQMDEMQLDPPGLIFLDLNMPGFSGFEFLRRFQNFSRRLTEQCSFVIVSSSSEQRDILHAKIFDNIKGYITKPADAEKLVNYIPAELISLKKTS